MKKSSLIVILISIFFANQACPQTRESFDVIRLTLNLHNKSAAEAFLLIQRKTGYSVNYCNTDIDKKLLFNLSYDQQPLRKILSDIAMIGQFKFLVYKKYINVAKSSGDNSGPIIQKYP